MTFYQHVGFEVLIGFAIGEVIPSVLKECRAFIFRIKQLNKNDCLTLTLKVEAL